MEGDAGQRRQPRLPSGPVGGQQGAPEDRRAPGWASLLPAPCARSRPAEREPRPGPGAAAPGGGRGTGDGGDGEQSSREPVSRGSDGREAAGVTLPSPHPRLLGAQLPGGLESGPPHPHDLMHRPLVGSKEAALMRDACQYGPDTPQGVAFLPILRALALGWLHPGAPPRPWGRRPLRNQAPSLSPRASLAPHLVLKLGPLPPCLLVLWALCPIPAPGSPSHTPLNRPGQPSTKAPVLGHGHPHPGLPGLDASISSGPASPRGSWGEGAEGGGNAGAEPGFQQAQGQRGQGSESKAVPQLVHRTRRPVAR